MGKLLPIILALLGLGAGAGAGIFLQPKEEASAVAASDDDDTHHPEATDGDHHEEDQDAEHDYVKLHNQFVVPVVHKGRVSALVVLSLSLEIPVGQNEVVFEKEPKIRDAFLDVMFDHANSGGFDGVFTETGNMKILRRALKEAAQKVMGPMVSNVLIVDLVRQDT